MAEQVTTTRQRTPRSGFLGGSPVRISWAAIFGGAVAALGVGLLLHTLGLAFGLSAIDADNPESLRSSGVFTGIWALITSFAALFIGGMVASRGAGALTKAGGAIHGLVMWGLTTLVGLWLLFGLLSSLASGAATVGRTAVQAGTSVASGAAQGAGAVGDLATGFFGLDAQDAVRPINERLRAEGRPTVTPQQLEAATRDVVQSAVQQGRLDRSLLVQSIAENTALTQQDAQEVANRIETQFNAAMGRVGTAFGDARQWVQTAVLNAADATGTAFWGLFGALLLGLLSAIWGATLGVSKRQRIWAERAATPQTWAAEPVPGQPQPG